MSTGTQAMMDVQFVPAQEPAELSSAPSNLSNAELVQTVVGAFTKIKEALPFILELKSRFAALPPGIKIAGCETWTAFCTNVLHRSDRAIRKAIAAQSGRKPERKSRGVLVPQLEEVEEDYVSAGTSNGWDEVRKAPPSNGPSVDELLRGQVSEAILQAAREIIKEGRRALAMKYHPDRGGSAEGMTVLNQAEPWLSDFD